MKKITFCILIILTCCYSLFFASLVEAQSQAPASCPACSSGSPQIQEYIKQMRAILTIINKVPNKNAGNIPGQINNINRQKAESSQRATVVKDASITITQQPAGIASDMKLLISLYDDYVAAANTIINTKDQRSTNVSTSIMTQLTDQLQQQVKETGMFSTKGVMPNNMTYKELMTSLIELHMQVAGLVYGTRTTINRNGYIGNDVTIEKITTYYTCAQTIPVCTKNSAVLDDMASSVKKYRGQIKKSRSTINQSLTAQYRTTDKRTSPIIQKGQGINKIQQQTLDLLSKTKGIIRKSGKVTIEGTTTYVSSSSKVSKGLFAQILNNANDEVLENESQLQQYAILSDSRNVTYNIPKITKKLYQNGVLMAQITKEVVRSCEQHCPGQNKTCSP